LTSEEDWTIYSLGFETQTTTEFTDDGVIIFSSNLGDDVTMSDVSMVLVD
jgi:hypothetical protein